MSERAMAPNWSTQQLDVFDWFSSGRKTNLIVRARAGTGKTTTILEGTNRAPDASALLCAFNKSIATELKTRLKNPKATAQTLHSVGYAAVRSAWQGIHPCDRSQRADDLTNSVCPGMTPDVIKRLVTTLHNKAREMAPHATKLGDITDLLYRFECEPEARWRASGYDEKWIETKALEAMELAARVKPVRTGIDFADMIFLPVRNGWLFPQYELVVVDEAQDMTLAQLEIAQGVCKGRMCIVGDDRQAIYGFRGADSGSLDRLKRELNAEELGLTTTYRCGRAIVAVASRLVPDFKAGEKNPDGLVTSLPMGKLLESVQLGDFILSRLNAPLVGVAMSLLRGGKRARIAGRDIGTGLRVILRKLSKNATDVNTLLAEIVKWEEAEIARLVAAGREGQVDGIRDKAETLIAICDGADSLKSVEERIEALFTDDGLGTAGVITCSSIHKAKGREADRVFVLVDTLYLRGRNQEEENLEYVAVTRAKKELIAVAEGLPAGGGWPVVFAEGYVA